nr:MAG TPA: hypothetical protein [Bacteriophage sp.]
MIGWDALTLRRQKTNSWISTAFPRTNAGKAFFYANPHIFRIHAKACRPLAIAVMAWPCFSTSLAFDKG